MKQQLEQTSTFLDRLRKARETCDHQKIPKEECPHCLLGPKTMRFILQTDEALSDSFEDFFGWRDYTIVYDSTREVLGTYNLQRGRNPKPNIPEGQTPVPVYAYVHSGVALSLSSFACPWDSGCSGYIFGPDPEQYPNVIQDLQAWINGEIYEIVEEHFNPITNTWDFAQVRACGYTDTTEAQEYIEKELTE